MFEDTCWEWVLIEWGWGAWFGGGSSEVIFVDSWIKAFKISSKITDKNFGCFKINT